MSSSPFEGVGKVVGLRVWRVKEFKLVEEAKQEYGHFFSGDCYLVLDTFLVEGRTRHHIHFWLGKDTTTDEAGSVAMFAAQLDDSMGGGPVQFRQPQGSESPEFLRLFPRLKYMAGGYASGFRDTSKGRGQGPVRLYQIKSPNKTCVQVFEVPCKLASLNHGDCFLLEDVGARQLWVWHGSAANIREKTRAIEAGNAFKEGTGIKLAVLDDGDSVSSEAGAFFSRLGCPTPPEPAAIKDPEADQPPPVMLQPPCLYLVGGGGSSFSQVSTDGSPLAPALLDPAGQFVLHAAGCVWVWTGAECPKPAPPLQVGDRFVSQRSLPSRSLVKAVKARFEPGLFTTYFADWGADGHTSTRKPGRDSFGNVLPGPGRGTDDQPFNAEEAAAAMLALAAGAGSGGGAGAGGASAGAAAKLEAALANLTASKIEVWVMISSSRLEVPRQEVGQFYDGASYVVLHSYSTSKDPSDLRYAVYSWQGRHCGSLEAGAAAVLAADLHKRSFAGRSNLVRVEQNLEPAHFVRLFKGAMIVRHGARPANMAPGRSPPGAHLYQVKGEAVAVAHAVEVPAASSSLSSGDCFVLEVAPAVGDLTPALPVVVWRGAGSSEGEQAVAAAVAGALAGGGAAPVVVQEGEEPGRFWAALGGKGPYPTASPRGSASAAPLLFHLQDCAGVKEGVKGLKVGLHSAFSQDMLAQDDVMLLDTGAELYVWYGATCKPTERPRARDVANRYLALRGRPAGTSGTGAGSVSALVEVEAGQEPPFFTCHFAGWDAKPVASIPDVYAERVRAMSLAKEGQGESSSGEAQRPGA